MLEIPVILPEITQTPANNCGYRTVNLNVPGPWAKKFVPENAIMPDAFTAEKPNRLGAKSVLIRLYEPEYDASDFHQPVRETIATLVWAHGGSFVRGGLDSSDSHWFATLLAQRGVRVITVDYSLITNTLKAPAPANDMGAVVKWVEAHYGGLILVGGASAGANLAAQAALLQAADASAGVSAPIDGLILLYPTMHRKQQERLDIEQLMADVAQENRFTPADIEQMYLTYMGDENDTEDTCDTTSQIFDITAQQTTCTAAAGSEKASLAAITALIEQIRENNAGLINTDNKLIRPYYAENPIVIGESRTRHLARLPKTLIINAELDDLRASGEQFAGQLEEARVPVEKITINRALHGFMTPDKDEQSKMQALETIEIILQKIQNW